MQQAQDDEVQVAKRADSGQRSDRRDHQRQREAPGIRRIQHPQQPRRRRPPEHQRRQPGDEHILARGEVGRDFDLAAGKRNRPPPDQPQRQQMQKFVRGAKNPDEDIHGAPLIIGFKRQRLDSCRRVAVFGGDFVSGVVSGETDSHFFPADGDVRVMV